MVDGEPVLRVRNLVTRFLRSGLLNRVTREVHAVEKVSLISGLAKRYRWWASLAAVNPPTGRALLRLVDRRAAKLSLTVRESIPCHPANFRHCAGILDYFSGPLRFTRTASGPIGDSIIEPLRVHGLLPGG